MPANLVIYLVRHAEKPDKGSSLSNVIGVPIDYEYKDKHYSKLVEVIQANKDRKFEDPNILICWHHGEILNFAEALGASSKTLRSSSNWPLKWPKEVYGWLLKIYFKVDGTIALQNTQAINEKLMPDDTVDPAFGK